MPEKLTGPFCPLFSAAYGRNTRCIQTECAWYIPYGELSLGSEGQCSITRLTRQILPVKNHTSHFRG